jgi:putative hydrolase of the HAD superfamily
MIETAIQLTNYAVNGRDIQQILDMGKDLLRFPIEPLPGVVEVLTELRQRGHRLMVLTKGDLFDQESKIARSGLGDLFDYVEVVSEKDEATYRRLLARYSASPADFVMIGNSLKSDILPVASLGFRAIHVPYHANWIFEHLDPALLEGVSYHQVKEVREVLDYLP